MYLENYGNCCGMRILQEFPSYGNKTRFLNELIRISSQGETYGQIQCVLGYNQNKFCSTGLKEVGFKLLRRFYNPNTGNTLYSYYLIINQPKKIKKKIKRLF